jgi:hypothetical protein
VWLAEIVGVAGVLAAAFRGVVRWIGGNTDWAYTGLAFAVSIVLLASPRLLHLLLKKRQQDSVVANGGHAEHFAPVAVAPATALGPATVTTPSPPLAVYSTLTGEPTLDTNTFEVLKWFSTFPKGAVPIGAVQQVFGMDYPTAVSCVERLWDLKFLRTVVVAPGEWNGQYGITPTGYDFVRRNSR